MGVTGYAGDRTPEGMLCCHDFTEAAHDLLQAESIGRIRSRLGALSVEQYLDSSWVSAHPNVRDAIALVEKQLENK